MVQKLSAILSDMKNVVAIALPGVAPFELGVICGVFGVDRTDEGLPTFDFAVVTENAEPVPSEVGFAVTPAAGLERAALADLVCVPAAISEHDVSPEGIEVLQAAVSRGARVLSVCTGAFALGAAGLLDGRRCTTHWMHVDELQESYPSAQVTPDVLYVDDSPVITSAGSAAGLDACLHLVREELGTDVANAIARRMLVPPYRDGGQAQYIKRPIPASGAAPLSPVLDWMAQHLDEDLSVEQLAVRAHMSPRTFARKFKAETGTTPHAWLTRLRVQHAERMLEQTDESIERVATASGFASSTLLRHHFVRERSTTPQAYRRNFRQGAPRAEKVGAAG
jgi:transcriptional regulator GlxA family with amidase domain